MKRFRIIEDRGCDIQYSRFSGTEKECQEWLNNNCWYDTHTNDYYSKSLDDVNGNNEPFTYYLDSDDDDFIWGLIL